ncbi:MAG: sulfatase-like hydrolase/transferase [Planctomycetales bacterium]|nr:sulfatase-like hydrolase/transferase [Planctomycetales bacterium]
MNRLARFPLCLKLFAFLLTFVAEPAWAAAPNILVIVADDLGYGDLSSFGATDLQSPHIDALMSRGTRLTNFYANCPVCSPTRAAILTGCYPDRVGVPGVIRTHPDDNWGYLRQDVRLLPEQLQARGYDTAAIGKWHLGLERRDHPNTRGFAHFRGFLGDMMDDYYHHRRHDINYMRDNEREINPTGHATDLFTQWAIDYLRAHGESDRPFFLYLAYNAPHTPIQPPEDWLAKVREREPHISPTRAELVALIEHLDDGVGMVLKSLRDAELADNTIILFTSDNGGQLSAGASNGALRDGKQSMYEGGLKVPTCVVWPGQIPAGRTSDWIGASMDILPTLCDVAGANVPEGIDGVSLWPALTGQGAPPSLDRTLYFVRREGNLRYNGQAVHALRQGPWKLVQNSPYAAWELFHLNQDPQEQHDLSSDEKQKYAELCAVLRRQIQRGGAVPWQSPDAGHTR